MSNQKQPKTKPKTTGSIKFKRADFKRWKKEELWTTFQAVSLIMGYEPPKDLNHPNQIQFIKPTNVWELFNDIYMQVKNSIIAKTIECFPVDLTSAPGVHPFFTYRFKPPVFLAWAQEKGSTIPDELRSLVGSLQSEELKPYKPSKPIYKLVLDKMSSVDKPEDYGWRGIIDKISSLSFDKDTEEIVGKDKFGEEERIKQKRFGDNFSIIKKHVIKVKNKA